MVQTIRSKPNKVWLASSTTRINTKTIRGPRWRPFCFAKQAGNSVWRGHQETAHFYSQCFCIVSLKRGFIFGHRFFRVILSSACQSSEENRQRQKLGGEEKTVNKFPSHATWSCVPLFTTSCVQQNPPWTFLSCKWEWVTRWLALFWGRLQFEEHFTALGMGITNSRNQLKRWETKRSW